MAKSATKRHRPAQHRARATREHILDTAARLFAERGITNTSTNRIAAEAEVSIGTVYRYFADRGVMVDELLERMMTDVERRLADRAADIGTAPPPQLIGSLLEELSAEVVAHAPLVRALAGGLQFYSTSIPEFEPRMRGSVEDLLTQILGPEPVANTYDMMAFVIVNTIFATLVRTSAREFDDAKRDRVVAATAEMITAWLRQRHTADPLDIPAWLRM